MLDLQRAGFQIKCNTPMMKDDRGVAHGQEIRTTAGKRTRADCGGRGQVPRCARRLQTDGKGNRLWRHVVRTLRRGLSPEQAARRLKEHYPDRPEVCVSHQTIYRAIVILPRGELKRELIPCLRRDGRPDRKAGVPSVSRRPWIERLVTERPADADDRGPSGIGKAI